MNVTILPAVAVDLLAALAGLAVGLGHFASLRWNATLFAGGGAAKAFALQLARLALTATVFFLLARVGAWPLLCGAGGWLCARAFALRRWGAVR